MIDRATGGALVVTGTEAATPTPPTIPVGKTPVAQVFLAVGQTAIVNADIADERNLALLGLGSLAERDAVAAADIADGAVTLAKLAAGPAGGTIGYDGAGNPVAVAPDTAGYVLTSNGPGAAPSMQPATGLASIRVFTASGTWTKPAGITKAVVQCVGGGGGGGGSNSGTQGGGGGGGGGYAEALIDVSTVSTVSVTVGAGGAGGSPGAIGGAGGTSSFGTYASATGGGGGDGSAGNGTAGLGGSGSGGFVNSSGGDGYKGTRDFGGSGGETFFGGGPVGSNAGAGNNGRAIGSGGSGAITANGAAGGAGAAGIVIVREYK